MREPPHVGCYFLNRLLSLAIARAAPEEMMAAVFADASYFTVLPIEHDLKPTAAPRSAMAHPYGLSTRPARQAGSDRATKLNIKGKVP